MGANSTFMLTAGQQRGEARTRQLRLQPQPQPAAPARRRAALPPAAAAPACGAGTRPRPPPALPTAPARLRAPGAAPAGGDGEAAAPAQPAPAAGNQIPKQERADPRRGHGPGERRYPPSPALARPSHRNVRGPGAAPAPRSNKRHRATGAEAPAALLVRAASPRSQVARGEPSSGGTARPTRDGERWRVFLLSAANAAPASPPGAPPRLKLLQLRSLWKLTKNLRLL